MFHVFVVTTPLRKEGSGHLKRGDGELLNKVTPFQEIVMLPVGTSRFGTIDQFLSPYRSTSKSVNITRVMPSP